jgi:gamma-glutamylcyclotransferase (GGCT)/AIG2-like uncharacterized protein YtfP
MLSAIEGGGMKENLFVYGTLTQNHTKVNKLLGEGKLRFECNGKIEAELYELGAYPGAIEKRGAYVYGEVYEVDSEETLQKLDAYEGYYPENPKRSLFTRQKTEVTMEDGTKILATVYFYNKNVNGLKALESGKWNRKTAGKAKLGV